MRDVFAKNIGITFVGKTKLHASFPMVQFFVSAIINYNV